MRGSVQAYELCFYEILISLFTFQLAFFLKCVCTHTHYIYIIVNIFYSAFEVMILSISWDVIITFFITCGNLIPNLSFNNNLRVRLDTAEN